MEKVQIEMPWEQFTADVNNLTSLIKEKLTIKETNLVSGVYGPPRGGLILATIISHKLKLPLLMHAAENCIIVDDIVDNGRLLCALTQYNKVLLTASLYASISAYIMPDIFIHEKPENSWIIFPWEV